MILLALSIGTVASAQTFRWGAQAGLEVVSPQDMNHKMGFTLGLKGELYFGEQPKGLFVDASLLFDRKNFEQDGYYNNETAESLKYSYSPYGITIPVNIGYKFQPSKQIGLFVAAGPYLNIGIDGNMDQTTSRYDKNGSVTYESTASYPIYDYLRRTTVGLGCKVGAELFSHYQISAGYNWGLNSMFKSSNSLKSKYRELTVSLSYMF